ncbi:MAG: hypothetical protein ACOH5I_11610 [Oligoflexus sp.]
MSIKSINPILYCCLAFLIGCTGMCSKSRQDMPPEEVVQTYLDISLNMSSLEQKPVLINLTTGNLRDALEQASDDVFTSAFITQNYHLESYSVVERRDRTPRETEITFLLTYRNLGPERELKPEDAPQIKTENTVSVVRYKGAWAIRDVLGKNTTIDFPLSQGSVITPGEN